MGDVYKAIIDVLVAEFDKPAEDIRPDHDFINDLGLDSLDVVELLMKAEELFEMTIPDKDAQKLRTPRLVAEYIEATLAPRATGELAATETNPN